MTGSGVQRARFVLALAMATACGSRHVETYPSDVADNFMKACTVRSEPRVCRCALDSLQEHFTLEQFRGFEARMRAGQVPNEMVDAVADCR